METTKVHLSPEELLLMHNAEWILTKNRVIEKLAHAMGQLGMRMQKEAEERKDALISEILHSNPKISRGEKYEGLPYIILDYPRIFEKENIFAIRTFFWWGKFCSITLHVNGKYLRFISNHLIAEYGSLQSHGFYLSVSGNEWNHDLTSSDYASFDASGAVETKNALLTAPFLKLSGKVEFNQWDKMQNELYGFFLVMLKLANA